MPFFSIARQTMNILYFTQHQMLLFTHTFFRMVIIRGVGGTGKTILLLLKLIDVFRKQLYAVDEDSSDEDKKQRCSEMQH